MSSTGGRPAAPQRDARRARVAGVAGGVGATTVARAIAGVDRGVFTGKPVDVLVCRATGDSILRASRAIQVLAASELRPVVAVTGADVSGRSRPVAARLRLLEPHAAAVVVLPFVRRWRELAVPLDDVRDLLTRPLTELPRPLRRYAIAARELRAALGAPRPPAAIRQAVPQSRPVPMIGRNA
ncbi:hypothetical protein [Pseudonocardia sp. DLS-67]